MDANEHIIAQYYYGKKKVKGEEGIIGKKSRNHTLLYSTIITMMCSTIISTKVKNINSRNNATAI